MGLLGGQKHIRNLPSWLTLLLLESTGLKIPTTFIEKTPTGIEVICTWFCLIGYFIVAVFHALRWANFTVLLISQVLTFKITLVIKTLKPSSPINKNLSEFFDNFNLFQLLVIIKKLLVSWWSRKRWPLFNYQKK